MKTVYVMREIDKHADFILRSGPKEESEEGRVRVDFGELSGNVSTLENDLGYVAASMLALEELHSTRKGFELGDWVRFPVASKVWDTLDVKHLIREIFSYTTRCSIKPQFDIILPGTQSRPLKTQLNSVCLFSGGIDSVCGILSLPSALEPTGGIFVHHAHLKGVVTEIARKIPKNMRVLTVSIQQSKNEIQQLRGFVYMCFGAVLCKLAGSDSLVISETGPTMYQPQYLPTDQVTLTTNPLLVELTKGLVERVLDIKLKVYEPFEDMTKAEAMAICSDKSLLSETNSCITSRFADTQFSHCGHCLGCVVRRLSALVVEVEGLSHPSYAYDVALMNVGENILAPRPKNQSLLTERHMDDLLMLLRFARGMLTEKLPPCTRSMIVGYKKEDLFTRFAMDIVAATHILSKQTRNSYISKFHRECMKDQIVTDDQLVERISQVREGKMRPKFRPMFQ
jgi:hypothetical protein